MPHPASAPTDRLGGGRGLRVLAALVAGGMLALVASPALAAEGSIDHVQSHDGSLCTVHSNGPRDTLSRIETMVLMAGMDLPIRAIREQVASAVDLIVHQTRFKDGSRHITHVTEVERMEGDVITLQDVFLYDHSKGFDENGRSLGGLVATGLRPKFIEKLAHVNVHVDPMLFAMDGV